MTEDYQNAFVSLEFIQDSEILAGFYMEETEDGQGRYALSTGETCGVYTPEQGIYIHYILLNSLLGIDSAEDSETLVSLPDMLSMLNEFLLSPKQVALKLSTLGYTKKIGENEYLVSPVIQTLPMSMKLSWDWEKQSEKLFDLSNRREVPFNFRDGLWATEGFYAAIEELRTTLLKDETIASFLFAFVCPEYAYAAESELLLEGNADELFEASIQYWNGEGVEQNKELGVKYLQAAADAGQAEAQDTLGYMYENGYWFDQNYGAAMTWYKKAAEQENAHAQFKIGCLYFYGLGVEQDYHAAQQWYEKAAEQEEASALNNLGVIYRDCLGISHPDYQKAAEYFKRSADLGCSEAQTSLGVLYMMGKGVQQDYKEARKYFLMAAKQGNVNAMYNLCDIYSIGIGVEPDPLMAIEWLSRAEAAENLK